jgi:hypothetical protein
VYVCVCVYTREGIGLCDEQQEEGTQQQPKQKFQQPQQLQHLICSNSFTPPTISSSASVRVTVTQWVHMSGRDVILEKSNNQSTAERKRERVQERVQERERVQEFKRQGEFKNSRERERVQERERERETATTQHPEHRKHTHTRRHAHINTRSHTHKRTSEQTSKENEQRKLTPTRECLRYLRDSPQRTRGVHLDPAPSHRCHASCLPRPPDPVRCP